MKALIFVSGYEEPIQSQHVLKHAQAGRLDYMPMLVHQIEMLKSLGICNIILSVGSLTKEFIQRKVMLEKDFGVTICAWLKKEPLGTGGWLALLKKKGLVTEPFFVMHSDVICHYPLEQMKALHETNKAEATMTIVKVDDPWNHFIVFKSGNEPLVEDILAWNDGHYCRVPYVSAKAYLLNPEVFDRATNEHTSLEKSILPIVARKSKLCYVEIVPPCVDLKQMGLSAGLREYVKKLDRAGASTSILGPPPIHAKEEGTFAKMPVGMIHEHDKVVVGPNCAFESQAKLKNCVLLEGAKVEKNAMVFNSILLRGAIVKELASVKEMSVVGEDIEVSGGARLKGAIILDKGGHVNGTVTNCILKSKRNT